MTQTQTPEDVRPLLTPAEAARLVKVSTKTVYREVDRGALPALHAGRQLRIEPTQSAAGWKAPPNETSSEIFSRR